MSTCNCPSDLCSLSQLCARCKAEYLKACKEAKAVDNVARLCGRTPETLGLPIPGTPAETNTDTIHKLNLRVAELECRLQAHARNLGYLSNAVRTLINAANGKGAA